MSKYVMQEFEKYRGLQRFILSMGSTGLTPSGSNWTAFLYELNKALSEKEQESIVFGDWIAENTINHYCDGVWIWRTKDGDHLTSTQLYQLYKESQQTKTK